MGRRDNEVDCTGGEGCVTSAHQLFGSLAFALAVDYLLAAIGERNAGTTWARSIVIGHRHSSASMTGYFAS
jgi:hypothetical protein